MGALYKSPIVEIRRSLITGAVALGLAAFECGDLAEYQAWQRCADKAAALGR